MVRACASSVRPAWVGVTPWRPRTRRAAPTDSSIWRMRVEAAARARWARSAPWVMLPASTTWRNRLKSARSKRTARLPSCLTKEDYANHALRSMFPGAMFRGRRSMLRLGIGLPRNCGDPVPLPKVVIHGSTLCHELRKQRGHWQVYGSSAAFDSKFLDELAAGAVGTSNRGHWSLL